MIRKPCENRNARRFLLTPALIAVGMLITSPNETAGGGMTIQPGKPEILGGNRKGGFPRIRVWRDGTIIVGGSAGRHERINSAQLMKLYDYFKRGKSLSQEALSREGFDDINLCGGYWALQSEDGGKTWADVKSDLLRILSGCSSGNLMELSDGTRLGTYTFMINTVKGSDKGQEMIVFRSKDKGATWQTEFAPVTGPAQCDPYWGDGHMAGTFYNSMLELPDGALLVFGIWGNRLTPAPPTYCGRRLEIVMPVPVHPRLDRQPQPAQVGDRIAYRDWQRCGD